MNAKINAAKAAIETQLVHEEEPMTLLFDMDRARRAVQRLHEAFGDSGVKSALHCFAVKANPAKGVMKLMADAGCGFECASPGELELSLRVASPEKIVYDSPIKTRRELTKALERGVTVNVDNFHELEMLREIRGQLIESGVTVSSNIGVRINPQVGSGSIAAFSTATKTSKFGVGLSESRAELMRLYKECAWLNTLLVHVGSQGVAGELAAQGIEAVVAFAVQVNRAVGHTQIHTIDIGGGLTVNFASEEDTPSHSEYCATLKKLIPDLFSGEFRIVTEFGRSLSAKSGFFLSRIEHTKVVGSRHVACQHVGANLAIRTIYHPEVWPLRVSALTAKGELREKEECVKQDVSGPCCFGADIIAHERPLPLLKVGDYILVHDVGGYYLASYSFYNAIPAPAMWGFTTDSQTGSVLFVLLQRRASLDDVAHFYSDVQ